MDENLQGYKIQYEEKILKVAELAKTAAEKTHTVLMARQKSQKAFNAIASDDKVVMWNTLQEYLQEYSGFINNTVWVTGLYIQRVDKEFYDNVTNDEIKKQLRLVVGFVYAQQAVNSAAKDTFKSCLKSLMKSSGKFTEAELDLLLF